MGWLADLEALAHDAERTAQRIRERSDEYARLLTIIRPVVARFARAWSGSWIGDWARTYAKDLNPTAVPEFDAEWGGNRQAGWELWNWDDFRDYVESFTALSLDDVARPANDSIAEARELTERATVSFAPASLDPRHEREFAGFYETTQKPLARFPEEVIAGRTPQRASSRNVEQVQKGIQRPHHIWLDAGLDASRDSLWNSEQRARAIATLARAILAREAAFAEAHEMVVIARWRWLIIPLDRSVQLLLRPLRLLPSSWMDAIETNSLYRAATVVVTLSTFVAALAALALLIVSRLL